MSHTLSFFAEEKTYDPLPDPCAACGHGVGVVSFRDKAIVSLRCQKCGAALDRSIVRARPLRFDCRCGVSAASGCGFITPNKQHNDLRCIACGAHNTFVSNSDLGGALPAYQRPKISEGMRLQLFEEADHLCLYHGGPGDLEAGHCLSVADGRALGMSDDVLFDWWNLCAMCSRCNQALGGRSVKPSTYITLLKPGEFDKPVRDPTFTKILVALGKARGMRQEAA
jgi:5-methylcytosine-specific restriction endonuclease McrA